MNKDQVKRRSGFDDPVGDIPELSAGGKIDKLLRDIHRRETISRDQPEQDAADQGLKKSSISWSLTMESES